jgi:hypothetical protein
MLGTTSPSDAPPPSLALLGDSRLCKIAHLDRHLSYPEREAPVGAGDQQTIMLEGMLGKLGPRASRTSGSVALLIPRSPTFADS